MSTEEEPRQPGESGQHQADGLDLARTLARATARAGPAQRVRRRRTDRRTGPAKASGAHPDERDPQLLDPRSAGWSPTRAGTSTCGSPACSPAGRSWSARRSPSTATPESFADGKLVVRTDSTAWATQMKLLAPTVVSASTRSSGTAR